MYIIYIYQIFTERSFLQIGLQGTARKGRKLGVAPDRVAQKTPFPAPPFARNSTREEARTRPPDLRMMKPRLDALRVLSFLDQFLAPPLIHRCTELPYQDAPGESVGTSLPNDLDEALEVALPVIVRDVAFDLFREDASREPRKIGRPLHCLGTDLGLLRIYSDRDRQSEFQGVLTGAVQDWDLPTIGAILRGPDFGF